jgi:hypothetical protein
MWILQNLTPWTGPVERFSRSGAKNFKNMSPKMRRVKIFSEKDGPQPGFRKGVRSREAESRGLGSGFKDQGIHNTGYLLFNH